MSRLALLFDLDGTLIDSDLLHYSAFATLMAERDRDLSLNCYKAEIMGQPNSAILSRFFPGEDMSVLDRKEAMFRASLGDRVEPLPGIHALLDWAEAHDTGVAVVTNAPRGNAVAMLAAAGLAERLPVLVIGDECTRPKPDPAPYQVAMATLGVTPSRAIAFEDSRSGLRAARASGARVFGLTTGLPAADLLQAGAHAVIADFTAPALMACLDALNSRNA